MKFPRFLVALVASSLLFLAGCGTTGGHSFTQPPPPPPPTGNNYTACGGQQVPNWRASAFVTNYKAAVQAMVTHFNGNSSVGYIRIGLGKGGEINLPQGWNNASSGACYGGYTTKWGYTAGADASFTWNAYLQDMLNYEGSLHSSKKLLVSITPISGVGVSVDDFIAPIAIANNMSFGNQGLESSDITNFPSCGGDWCNLFAQYHPAVTELQTLGQSCPASSGCPNQLSADTGPLPPLLPFATAHGANDLELYYQDWLIAYDPNYSGNSVYGATYKAAIETAAPLATMQVLFPPTNTSDPDYVEVQNHLMNNSVVDGVVIAVNWSDFDLGNGNYDFTITDNLIQPWIAAGKKVNLTLQNTTYGGGANCPGSGPGSNGNVGNNCAMPPWMWTVLAQ